MHIGIDARPLLEKQHSGVQELTRELIYGLLASRPRHRYTIFATGREDTGVRQFCRSLKKNFPATPLAYASVNLPNRLLNIGRFPLRPLIGKALSSCQVLLLPNFHIVPLTNLGIPSLLIFHDLSFVHGDHFFSLYRRLWHKRARPRQQAHEAKRLVAVSRSTAADLQTYYGIAPEKITVVYPGIHHRFRKLPPGHKQLGYVRAKYRLPRKFILFLATLEPRKNLTGCVRVFQMVAGQPWAQDLHLVVAGAAGWGGLNWNRLKDGPPRRFRHRLHWLSNFDPSDRPALYNLAHAFLFPSFFEGFGFPPLEAMACGVPVVTADVSSLPEVTGLAALHVNPYRLDDLAAALTLVCTDQSLRAELITRGLAQAQKFTWEKSAGQVAVLLEKLVKF